MKDKMRRFLNSINIENLDDFDMDFDLLAYDMFDKKKLNMMIVKNTPWTYPLIREFQDHLICITYKYSLAFSYVNKPDFKDVEDLFLDWFQTVYRIPFSGEIKEIGDKELLFVLPDELNNEIYRYFLDDFADFLNFIGYDFHLDKTYLDKIEEEVTISNKEMRSIIKKAEKEAKVFIKESAEDKLEVNDKNDVISQIEEEHRKLNIEVGDALMKIMLENKAEMERERERNRRNKRGNYKEISRIDDITAESGNIDFNGKVFSVEEKSTRNGIKITVGVHDEEGGAIKITAYENGSISKELIGNLSKGSNIRIRGVSYFDEYSKEILVKGHYLDILPPDVIQEDPCEIKRVELHLHSNMSTQDGINEMRDYIQYAKTLGHKAIAITDHGVVQAFPDAQNALKKDDDFKVIYGCEFYMVDSMKYVFNPRKSSLKKATYVVLDLETTGLSPRYDRIIEFGATKVKEGFILDNIDILIDPEIPLSNFTTELTGLTNKMVHGKPTIKEVLPKILEFCKDAILVTHNAKFDFSFLQEALKACDMPTMNNIVIDTLTLSRFLFPEAKFHSLGSLCSNMDVRYDEEEAHRADYDARVLNEVWQPMIGLLGKQNINDVEDLEKLDTPIETLKHIRPTHCIALVKNQAGVRDLYELVSLSHIKYFAKNPKVPRRELQRLRKNLLLGSACFNGDVFDKARTSTREDLKDAISFYDYIEVQPPGNYSPLVNKGVISEEQVLKVIKDIIEVADELGKPVVATGDVHYLRKSDKIFRDVYISAPVVGKGLHDLYPGTNKDSKLMNDIPSPDQHYRTTLEMLECFSFLGEEKAYEIVVKNTNMIADQIEKVIPAANDTLYTPNLKDIDVPQTLTEICYKTAHETFGENIPEEIKARLDRELKGIIDNGYAVIYYIAHRLVKKSNDDGYIVGSRGSVGSSFVATMANITEVNPLPPYYLCPKCKHFEWGKDSYPNIKSGYDLPHKNCPHCGNKMNGEGQNIPFETFLGFNADKVPDIDLNFPRDYQATAHEYTKVIVGEHNVFRAGTIETVAEKTAFGFARGYIEKKYGEDVLKTYPNAKLAYIASGCEGVKRTTGQHPGGIVVLPEGHEIYEFTPIQYPADDQNSPWKTTHFDFEKIHDTLLKLDMLGHLDPMALKMMCELTNVNLKDIPFDDPKVLSLFSSSKALNMERDYLGNRTGAMALPEFGTENTRRTLEATSPKTFADLVVISGLSHGTGVWQGNAEELIKSGNADLQSVIGCRDDIMTYLMSKGISSSVAFSIMETVRKKGKTLSEEYISIMRASKVPEWYIDSCNKIEYLFPKGHATAYVIMAVRVAYFKLYYPLEFYATFFSVRSKQFDIDAMIRGDN